MKTYQALVLLFALVCTAVNGFAVSSTGGSSFVVSQRPRPAMTNTCPARNGASSLQMGGSSAKFGIFSPAVYAAKVVLGKAELNKLRGKGISLHSQAIGDFCKWAGAYHLRTRLIKLAKTNGDFLGFLV